MFRKKSSDDDFEGKIVPEDSIPTKPGDPTLIVDLPDGQKLIVGQMEPGTVIEVATWRGTGRPDSRTTRMLLGAGVNEEARRKAISAPKSDKNDSVFSVSPEPRESSNQLPSGKKDLTLGKHGVTRKNIQLQKYGYVAAAFIFAIFVPVAIANNGIFQVTTPDLGISTKLGSAESILVFTTNLSEPNNGDVVIASIDDNGQIKELLAKVVAVGGNEVLVQANQVQYQLPSKLITSKVRFVIPFVGKVAKVIGA